LNSARRPIFAIQLQGVTKVFGRQRVLRGVNLEVQAGESVALLGPNGAGKTTLMRIMATLSRPSDGQVWVNGLSIERDAENLRRRLGLVSHQTFLYGELTAAENLHFYGQMYGVPHLTERVDFLLQQVGLYERRRDPVRTYSRGMQQRLSIARAIIHAPPILLLDEPDTGLDQKAARSLRDLLDSFGEGERTVLLTTHHLDRALAMSSRVAILAAGVICWEHPTDDLTAGDLAMAYSAVTEGRGAGGQDN